MNKNIFTRVSCIFVLCATLPASLLAQTFHQVYNFHGTDGEFPSGLMQAADGSFYGSTQDGGTFGNGSIYKITSRGQLTTLHSFCSAGCTDGAYPRGALIQAPDGSFYGTTGGGGHGFGTVFKITPSGVLTTLYSFCPNGLYHCNDGSTPLAGLVLATDGNFYGTTEVGGAQGFGTVFRISPNGRLKTIHVFESTDGGDPVAPLVQASDGNLYGTTTQDGAHGAGTLFRITPGSGALTTIYSFCSLSNCADGIAPNWGLIQATDGNLYGNTGGSFGYYGTTFKITLDGALNTLYTFCSLPNCADGTSAESPLVQGADGNFYGTGGALVGGSIFELTPQGALTTLYEFPCSDKFGCPHGNAPNALILGTNGVFFGTTDDAGLLGVCSPYGCGTLFSLDTRSMPQ